MSLLSRRCRRLSNQACVFLSQDFRLHFLDSRSKLKQYVLANNKGLEAGLAFDNNVNKAIKSGVDKGEFAQPKGVMSCQSFVTPI